MKFSMHKFRYQFTKNQASNEEIHKNILENMDVHGSNFIILMCAIIIASIGLNMNSVAVIIGAMLISPLMGSIIGIGYGVSTYNVNLLKHAFKILAIAIAISIATSTLYFSLTPITTAGSEILSRTSPTIWDVIIAFVGGIAGMIGITRSKTSNVIPGVAIATALMPPLCTVGYGIATRQPQIFLGAGYLFFINGFFISISTFIVTKVLIIPDKNNVDYEKEHKLKRFIIISSIIVMIPSMISAVGIIKKTIYENNLNEFIKNELDKQYILSKTIDVKNNTITLVTIGDRITEDDIKNLDKALSSYGLGDKKLIIKQDEGDMSNLEKYISAIQDNRSNIMRNNYTINDESGENTLDGDAIFKEIQAIYPSIEKVYVGYLDEENVDNDKEESIPTIIIYSNDDGIRHSLNSIESWFKTRTNSDRVIVYLEDKNDY